MSASFTSQTAAYLRFNLRWNLSLLFFSQSLHCRSLTLLCCTLCFLFVCFFCFTALFLYEIIELFETGFKLSHRAPALLGSFWWLFIMYCIFLSLLGEINFYYSWFIHSLIFSLVWDRYIRFYTVTSCEPWHSKSSSYTFVLGSKLCQFFCSDVVEPFCRTKGVLIDWTHVNQR